jgi:hypothetical protein
MNLAILGQTLVTMRQCTERCIKWVRSNPKHGTRPVAGSIITHKYIPQTNSKPRGANHETDKGHPDAGGDRWDAGSRCDHGFYSGNALYNECVGGSAQQLICQAYVAGAVDMMLSPIVLNFLIAHPETRHYTAASEVVIAISAAFPCQEKPQ